MAQPAVPARNIILFDGICNFCSRTVLFMIRHDKKDLFRFAAAQTPAGAELLRTHRIESLGDKSVILISDGVISTKSSAILRICRNLDGLLPLLYGFMIVPKFIRDFFYDIFSRNRNRWFGARDSCFLPDEKIRQKFL